MDRYYKFHFKAIYYLVRTKNKTTSLFATENNFLK